MLRFAQHNMPHGRMEFDKALHSHSDQFVTVRYDAGIVSCREVRLGSEGGSLALYGLFILRDILRKSPAMR